MTEKNKELNLEELEALKSINLHAAGIDIGSTSHFVAISEDYANHVREFPTSTKGLIELTNWLKEAEVTTVAIKPTNNRWIPVYDRLGEHGFEVLLINVSHIKNIPDKKADVLDCQWIQQLHADGLLSSFFCPEEKMLQPKTLIRFRAERIEYAASHIQHIQEFLSLMNIQLNRLERDVKDAPGMRFIRAIIEGERDPEVLASYKDFDGKSFEEVVRESLIGNYKEEHMFCLKQNLQMYDLHLSHARECEQAIEKMVSEMESISDSTE